MNLNISAYSIKNPLIAILLFILLTIGGIFGFYKMKVQQFPDTDFPAVVVTITLPGAAPNQLENDVAKKVENRLNNIEGIKDINTVLQTGAATFISKFALEKDIQEAVDDVNSAIGEIKGELPASANEPVITKLSTSGFPVVTYSIASNNMTVSDLSWFVDNTISKRLSGLKGVGKVSRLGGVNRQITVEANPVALNGWKMSISQLSQQVASTQQDLSGGEFKAGEQKQNIRVFGAVKNANELNDLQITLPNGGVQRLANMATIIDGTASPTSIVKLNGKTVVAFNINRSRGASEVEVAKRVDGELEKIKQEYPDLTIEKIYDRATPVYDDYKASMRMLIEGAILAVVVVVLFLRNIRATIVAAIALPLSVIPTFLGMYFSGFSINLISLLALSLVIGVLVDDAIVEVENIIRHLRMGKTPYQAAMEAADEIGLAVIATTFTLIAVFLPTAFMSGVVGQFFRQFGWTAAMAIFVSLLVARLITPMMAAYILRPETLEREKQSKLMYKYLQIVDWTLKHRLATMVLTLILFILSFSMVKLLPTNFIPNNDTSQTRVAIELTPDASLEDTANITAMAREKVLSIEGVTHVLSSVGQAQSERLDSNHGSSSNIASLDIVLAPRGERPRKSEIEQKITEALLSVPSARFTVGLSSSGENGYSFSLTSANTELLEATVEKITQEIRTLPIVSDVMNNRSLPRQELAVIPNRLNMADNGITTQSIADTLRIATMGDYEQRLSKLNLDTRQIPIVVKLPDTAKQNLADLNSLYLPSNQPLGVKISDVADLKFTTGESEINRYNRERAITITVLPATGENSAELGEVIKAIKKLPSIQQLKDNDSINFVNQGQAADMAELFTGFIVAMSVGIICILGVLILLFERILQPFTILMALPLSIGGAFIGLVLTGSSLSMPSMIGFIMLMGIATKNSILLVDYALIAQKQGMDRFHALIDACRKRARPIIMTTIAMGAGMLPLLLGLGNDDPTFRQPMAAAVLGGLVTSTLLSLIVIPVVYTLMDDVSNWFSKK